MGRDQRRGQRTRSGSCAPGARSASAPPARSRWRLAAAKAQRRAPLRGETPAGGRRHCSGARAGRGGGRPRPGAGGSLAEEGDVPPTPPTTTTTTAAKETQNLKSHDFLKIPSPRLAGKRDTAAFHTGWSSARAGIRAETSEAPWLGPSANPSPHPTPLCQHEGLRPRPQKVPPKGPSHEASPIASRLAGWLAGKELRLPPKETPRRKTGL